MPSRAGKVFGELQMRGTHRCSVRGSALLILCALSTLQGCKSSQRSPTSGDPKTDAVLVAADRGRLNQTMALLDKGASVNAANSDGGTLLHLAANHGHDELTEALIVRGANVNAQDKQGNTPLHLAAIGDHDKTVRKLIAGGAKSDIRNANGKTPADICDPSVKGLLQP